MTRIVTRILTVAAVAAPASVPLLAQTRARAENVPEIPFESVPNFLQMPPDVYLGESMGVARNSKGHVFVYHRRDDTRLFEFDATGKFVREWTPGLYGFEFAHKVRVDAQDNVWVVDEGTNMVIKFSPEGRVLMVLGRRPDAVEGAVVTPQETRRRRSGICLRGRPTWGLTQGNIFVTDGYINHRLVKCDRTGEYIRKWEHDPGQRLSVQHAARMAVDARNVYVADRGTRGSVFDNNLAAGDLRQRENPWNCACRGASVSVLVELEPGCQSAASWAITGGLQDGTGRADCGQVRARGQGAGTFQTVHGIDCKNPDELIVSEISAWRVQKIRLRPPATTTSSR
jgi:hypothetical protein